MNTEPVVIGAALQGLVAAVGGVVIAATSFTDELDVAIGALALAVGVVVNIVSTRGKVTPTN